MKHQIHLLTLLEAPNLLHFYGSCFNAEQANFTSSCFIQMAYNPAQTHKKPAWCRLIFCATDD